MYKLTGVTKLTRRAAELTRKPRRHPTSAADAGSGNQSTARTMI